MRLFSKERNPTAYQIALERYIEYLSIEEVYTYENLSIVANFEDWVNRNYARCETLLFSSSPLEDTNALEFLGIDIVDEHLKSIIKKGKVARYTDRKVSRYSLVRSYTEAQSIIRQMKMLNDKYADLSCGYVYLVRRT